MHLSLTPQLEGETAELHAATAVTAMLLRHCPRPLRATPSTLQRLLSLAGLAQGTLKARGRGASCDVTGT